MTTSNTPKGPERLDSVKLAGVLDRAVTEADNHRAEGLGRASTLTNAHVDALRIESSRVSGKYGAGSPRAAQLATRLAVQSAVAATTKADSERTSVGVPQVPADAAVVFGRVVTAAGAGVAQMTVAALDARGATVTYACSGANGEFSLTIPFTAPGNADATRENVAREQQIVLQVTDGTQATRFRDAQPMTIALGKAAYRELTLGDPIEGCTPPPETSKKK